MASNSHKPLPAIPRLTNLSVDAREHLLTFIRHTLSEDFSHSFSENEREDWVRSLDGALEDLGQSFARGGWLTGIKRARNRRRSKARAVVTKDPKSRAEGSTEGTSESELHVEPANTTGLALQQIREVASKHTLPTPKPAAKHLLLCVAPLGIQMPLPSEDSGFSLVPANVGCVFSPGVYSLPESSQEIRQIFLYGFNEWDVEGFTPEDDDRVLRLVGGTFSFKGVNSPLQYNLLCNALRIALYVYLSLLLEQHFLANSHVYLRFPKPPAPRASPSYPNPPTLSMDASTGKSKNRSSFMPSGILSFFTKKHMQRSMSAHPSFGRGSGSLDLVSSRSGDDNSDQGPRSSVDGTSRLRTFSFISDARPSFLKTSITPSKEGEAELPFSTALKCIEESKHRLSTSPGVVFPPPYLIAELAAKETRDPSRRLTGDEKAGLVSVLGWDCRDGGGKGMSGTPGFIKQQEFSVLYSQHVPAPPSSDPPSSSSLSASTTASSQNVDSLKPAFSRCDRERWITYRYYSREDYNKHQVLDKSLGETITDLASGADIACDILGCQYKRGKHELRFIHGGIRIVVTVELGAAPDCKFEAKDDAIIHVWEHCSVCRAKTGSTEMNDGTYLFSFAKFLELLVYSPAICTIIPSMCEHTTPSSQVSNSEALPPSRLNIVRNFTYRRRNDCATVSFSISEIKDIFELRVPRLQITRRVNGDKSAQNSIRNEDGYGSEDTSSTAEEEKKLLRREIKAWWQGISDHIDKLEAILTGDDLDAFRKSLPRLPSEDEAYEDTESPTPFDKRTITGLPSVSSPSQEPSREYFPITPAPSTSSSTPTIKLVHPPLTDPDSSSSSTPSAKKDLDPMRLLSHLRHSFQRTEQTLYSELSHTPQASLNDVRRSFISSARGATKRLMAWQNKHLPAMVKAHVIDKLDLPEPQWWGKGCHAIPGGNVLVREDDWGSIIAFTLGSSDYRRELINLVAARTTSSHSAAPPTSSILTPSSFFAAANGYRLFSSAQGQPDPDKEDVVWYEPEAYSAVVSRKEHPRDPTSLLSIRDVLRQPSPLDGTNSPSSRFNSLGASAARSASGVPPSAWAKPDVKVSMQAADGEVTGIPESVDTAGKILHDIDSVGLEPPRSGSSMSGSYSSSSGHGETQVRRGMGSSVLSVESDSTIGPDHGNAIQLTLPPPPPPKDTLKLNRIDSVESRPSSTPSNATASSFASTLTNGLTHAMRFMLNAPEGTRSPSPSSKNRHGLLFADAQNIDERPHIKYDWTIGKRLKFSCTVYYAKQFDSLRSRCGIPDDAFIKSLSRSANWAAEGGKSKSNFRKTWDDRFIIKTLVNAWNVADLQVLIELAPQYFRYMDATANKATVLAKLIGFYTIEIRNLETGTVQSKADLLVMENLFYNQKIVKTFDLKGIQGRKVKAGNTASTQQSKTLFDGEWIESQQRAVTLVRPHSKIVLREAIKSDADFLAKSNIMDYSLLLGVDEECKQIVCGLVDTIGSYTFAKTLEYKAKQGLNSGKEVTVIPPAEYQERLVSALEGYFLACPDKWSRPLDGTPLIGDLDSLPSVL